MRLLLLLVAIYSLIFYQHYKLAKSKTLLSGAKLISATGSASKYSTVLPQKENSINTEILTASHSLEYKSNQWKPQMAGFTVSNGNR